ncbi:unnamed protein product [Thelazia callipaeda]|uniref:SCP domain-containing protein n=1 Tax=Thelazia callipaeda TaxID=103827 RepID=A0A0N5D027_THECL|nr:unnamed protein product [Thelazia callipaeda]
MFDCGDNEDVSRRDRGNILRLHNKLRMRLATGEEKDRSGRYMPKAKNMSKFMAWAKTTQVGCATCAKYDDGMPFIYLRCQYYPKGVFSNQKIYDTGEPCTGCQNGTYCRRKALCGEK